MTGSPSDVKSNKRFATRNLGLAAYLWYEGHEPIDMTWKKGICQWRFEDKEELQTVVSNYGTGEARVDPKIFYQKFVEFKRMSFGTRPDSEA